MIDKEKSTKMRFPSSNREVESLTCPVLIYDEDFFFCKPSSSKTSEATTSVAFPNIKNYSFNKHNRNIARRKFGGEK